MATRQHATAGTDGSGTATPFPQVLPLGLCGVLVRFGDTASETANRAALAFRAALAADPPPGMTEAATTLASVAVLFDPLATPPAAMHDVLHARLDAANWFAVPLPEGRRLWRIPAAFGDADGPGLAEAAEAAGMSAGEVVEAICGARLRVLAIGFAPGQPYLGTLPPDFDLPRQTGLTPRVPVGAIGLAVRQLTLFSVASQTGWRQVGRTAFRAFRPEARLPLPLAAGDEVALEPVSAGRLSLLDGTADGGARSETL